MNSSSTGNLSGTSPSSVVVPVICAGHCNKAFSSENDRMVECERCTQFTCIECLGISKEQYSFIGEDWCTILCNNCRPLANKEMKEGRSVEIQCKDFLVQHNQKMVELELKINLKADKSVVDTLESNQHSTNAMMEGLAYDISNLNKKIELMFTYEKAKEERARNVVFRGVPEAADTNKTILNIFEYCITRYFRGRKFSRKMDLRYFREKIFSRIYCSRENIFPRKFLPAKISSREIIFPRIVSGPQICRLVCLGYVVYYSIT